MGKIVDIDKCTHPNSRKTNAILKQIKKSKNREKKKSISNIKQNLLAEKIAWFRDNLEPGCTSYTPKQSLDLINKYLMRFNEELKQIKAKHSIGQRKNRQHANREDAINLIIKREREEFTTCGIETPDLLNAQQFNVLKTWQGELRYISNFRLKRYSEKFLQNEESRRAKNEKVVAGSQEEAGTKVAMDMS